MPFLEKKFSEMTSPPICGFAEMGICVHLDTTCNSQQKKKVNLNHKPSPFQGVEVGKGEFCVHMWTFHFSELFSTCKPALGVEVSNSELCVQIWIFRAIASKKLFLLN